MLDDFAFVAIYRAGAAHDEFGDWDRPETAGTSQLILYAPAEPGAYEMRLYRKDYEYTDATFVMRMPFTVGLAQQGRISLPGSAFQAGQEIPVMVSDISQEMEMARAFIGIYRKGAGHDDSYIAWSNVRAGNSTVNLRAPAEDGEFEVRLYSQDHRYSDETLVMSVPFSVSGAVEQTVSDWAVPEIAKADELGLIPDSLKNADLTKPITRAEFAAVSVKLYEKLSGQTASPVATNPFRDTQDAEVLKAFNLGITNGVAPDRFAPSDLLNREQAATMLTRVFKRAFVAGWTLEDDAKFEFNYQMPARFADDDKISDWAKPSVYFMAAHGIIEGVGNNMFAPRATTTAEEAANYAIATREQALAIAVRMTEKLDAGDAGKVVPVN